MLKIQVLGGAALWVDAAAVRLPNRKARAIAAYLVMRGKQEEGRERLAGLFWSETEEVKARATLRQAVHELKEALHPHGAAAIVHSSKLALGLAADMVTCDVDDIVAALKAHHVPDLLLEQERLSDTLLAGFEDLDPAFHGWLLARRQSLHDLLCRLLQAGYRSNDLSRLQRRRFAEAARRLDPSDEEACRALMTAAAEDGDPITALRAYNELWTLLDQDYDTEPSPATVQLVAEIKQGRFDAPPAPKLADARHAKPAPATQAEPIRPSLPLSVQITEFGANGIDPSRAHLVAGFRHELIACLAKFREWRVVDAAATRTGGDSRYELEATAYQAGASIQMVLTLRDGDRGVFVWSERFDLRLDDWFEVQRHIVRRVAITLGRQISAQRLSRLAAIPDVSLDVYDRWLRAQAMTLSFNHRDWQQARSLLEDTILAEPSFSPVYSTLVQMRNIVHIVFPGTRRDPGSHTQTLTLARRAMDLDPDDSRAHLCLGWSYAMAGKYAQADVHMGLACDLNPNDPWTLISAALFHGFNGTFQTARALTDHAFSITALPGRTYWAYRANIAYLAGDDAAAADACDRAEDVISSLSAWKAAALHNLGRQQEAEYEATRFLDAMRTNWFTPAPVTDSSIGDWLLHLYPISRAELWERLRRGISGAGVPAGGMTHNGW